MKKIIFAVLILLNASCYFTDNEIDVGRVDNYIFDNDIPQFNTLQEAVDYLYNIHGETDLEIWQQKEYWQTPEQTYSMKTGDCEDYCLLLSYILKDQFNFSLEILVIIRDNEYHTIVYIKDTDQYIDANAKWIYLGDCSYLEKLIVERIPYEEALWMTVYYHKLVGKYAL